VLELEGKLKMTIQFKTINNLEITGHELKEWASSRETSEVVALGIHAISDSSRTPEQIWEAPTNAEFDHVVMAVRSYIDGGLYDYDDGVFNWGLEKVDLNPEE
jgi:hypothetical protein